MTNRYLNVSDGFEITELGGIIRNIRNPLSKKVMKEVCVKRERFRRNNFYGTYNSVDNNELLFYKDANKIRRCQKWQNVR